MKVIQLWKDKNGRVRKEVLNTLGMLTEGGMEDGGMKMDEDG
jgi:hypothetical protein